MSKPLLLLQIRDNPIAAKDEYRALLEFGGLTSSRLRSIRLALEPIPPDIKLDQYAAVVVGGGQYNVRDAEKSQAQKDAEHAILTLLEQIIDQDYPYFGICYGMSILSEFLGAPVARGDRGESVGAITLTSTDHAKSDPLTAHAPRTYDVFTGHKEATYELPQSATLLAHNTQCPIQMYRLKTNIYAVQFHPELDAAGLAIRINLYQNDGYFPTEELENVLLDANNAQIETHYNAWREFVKRYLAP